MSAVDARLEEDLGDADGGVGGRLDVLDIVDGRGERALEQRRHAAGHLLRRQAGVLPDDRDDRDADVGEDIDRRAQRRQRPDDQDREREHDKGVGTPQGDADDANHARAAPPCRPRAPCTTRAIRETGESGESGGSRLGTEAGVGESGPRRLLRVTEQSLLPTTLLVPSHGGSIPHKAHFTEAAKQQASLHPAASCKATRNRCNQQKNYLMGERPNGGIRSIGADKQITR